MEIYRDLSGQAYIILHFFKFLHERKQKLYFIFYPPPDVAADDWLQKSCSDFSRCAAENMTSPVLFEHYIRFFYSAQKPQKTEHKSGRAHAGVHDKKANESRRIDLWWIQQTEVHDINSGRTRSRSRNALDFSYCVTCLIPRAIQVIKPTIYCHFSSRDRKTASSCISPNNFTSMTPVTVCYDANGDFMISSSWLD